MAAEIALYLIQASLSDHGNFPGKGSRCNQFPRAIYKSTSFIHKSLLDRNTSASPKSTKTPCFRRMSYKKFLVILKKIKSFASHKLPTWV